MNAYDPLDYENLARSVVNALLSEPQVVLPLSGMWKSKVLETMTPVRDGVL